MSWLIALLILSLMIFIHELGHYLAARIFGVYVEVFSIGFGKKLFSFRKFNTEWQISAIPLGGFVKMKGQNDSDPLSSNTEPDSYTSKRPWQRIIILFAGPFANFFLAWGFLLIISLNGVPTLSPIIGEVIVNSPANHAGLVKNDKIISINHNYIQSWKDVSEAIKSTNSSLTFHILREQKPVSLVVTPTLMTTQNMFHETIEKPMVGIAPKGDITTLNLNLFQAVSYSLNETYESSLMIFQGIEKLLTGVVSTKEIGGVVSITQVTANAASAGWISLFYLSALISVNLGVLNLLPIPALDGGHIVFNLYEMLFRKPISETVMLQLTILGWIALLGLMTLGLYNDLTRIFG